MPSPVEKERKQILERLNNLGRRLEKESPSDAPELNAELEKVIKWVTARLPKK